MGTLLRGLQAKIRANLEFVRNHLTNLSVFSLENMWLFKISREYCLQNREKTKIRELYRLILAGQELHKKEVKMEKRSKRLWIALHLLWTELKKEFIALTHKKMKLMKYYFGISLTKNFFHNEKNKYIFTKFQKIKFEKMWYLVYLAPLRF